MSQQEDRNLDFVLKHYKEGVFDTRNAIEQFRLNYGEKPSPRRKTHLLFAVITVAAAIILGVFLYPVQHQWTDVPMAMSIQTVILPDGTNVTLAPGASLSYSFDDRREVRIQGKVYFDVFRDETKPFEIESDNVFVRVVGTEFMVDVTKNPEVYVEDGKVLFARKSDADGVLLSAGMSARLENGAEIPEIISDPDVNSIAWKRGTFIFDKTPLRDVLNCLSRYYQVSFVATDLSKELSGEFATDDLDLIITLIESALDVTIVRR